MIYGENDSVRTRDGLVVMNKEKVYFRPGNFYDNKDNLISVDIIRLYYYDDNDNEVILLTGAAKTLIIELEQSQETFMNLLNQHQDLYIDACYNKFCTKIKLDYFNDFTNDNVMVNNLNDESVIDASSYSSDKSNLINGLIKNGFKYDSEIDYYYLKEDGVEYYYFPKKNMIKITNELIDSKYFSLNVYLYKNLFKLHNYQDENDLSININDKSSNNYDVYLKYYNQYLSKYFKDFLEV